MAENQHFFKPLLTGFHSHLTIPVAFFLKNMEGRSEQKMVELRSDASEITWEVKIDGQRLTDGWKEFALAHDLRIGDIVVFRQERDMSFHVTLLGPSCCEIQYGSSSNEESNLEKSQRKKKVEKSPSREAESSSLDSSCFVANVAPSSLRYDLLHLPRPFVRENGVVTGSGEIVLMNEKGRSWNLRLKQKPSCGTIYITGGWRSFCDVNGLRAGDFFTFKMIQREGTLVLRLLAKEPEEEANDVSLSTEPDSDEESNIEMIERKKKVKKNPNRYEESSSLDPSCFVANVTPATLRYDRLNLPRSFMRENGLETRCGEIVLMNEKGRSWTLDLRGKKSFRSSYIKRGWRSFCHANGVRAGSFLTFKLIQKGRTLVLRLSPNEPDEQGNEVSLSAELERVEESNLGKILRKKKMKKNPRREIESSSLDPSCFVANVSPSTLRYDLLYLPKRFVRANGLNIRCREMILMNEKGRSWTLLMKQKNSCGTTYIKRGWRSFCRANGLKAGSFSTFKLIQNGKTVVLRLSPKEPEEEKEEEECSEANKVESLSTEPSDEESSQDEKSSQECSKRKERKSTSLPSIWKASSSASQDRFVTVTLTHNNISVSRLVLPIPFTKANGIKKAKKMSFLDKHGVKWSTKLRFDKERRRMRLVGGWKEFCDANGVKIGESIMLELIWEADRSSVLKFCSKVVPETK